MLRGNNQIGSISLSDRLTWVTRGQLGQRRVRLYLYDVVWCTKMFAIVATCIKMRVKSETTAILLHYCTYTSEAVGHVNGTSNGKWHGFYSCYCAYCSSILFGVVMTLYAMVRAGRGSVLVESIFTISYTVTRDGHVWSRAHDDVMMTPGHGTASTITGPLRGNLPITMWRHYRVGKLLRLACAYASAFGITHKWLQLH